MLQCCHVVLCYAILDQNRPVCWSIVLNKKPTVGSPFFGTFHSDRIPKAMTGVNIQFSVHSTSSCTLHQRTPVNYTVQFRNYVKLLRMFAVSLLIIYMSWHTEWPQKMYTLFTHQYLWNKFKWNFYFRVRVYYNVFSTDGTGALIIFAQQMAQVLLAGADNLKCIHT